MIQVQIPKKNYNTSKGSHLFGDSNPKTNVQTLTKQKSSKKVRGKRQRDEQIDSSSSRPNDESIPDTSLLVSGLNSSVSRIKLCVYLSPYASPENIIRAPFSPAINPRSILHTSQSKNPSYIIPSTLLNFPFIYGQVPGLVNIQFRTHHPVECLVPSNRHSTTWIPSVRRELELLSLIDSQTSVDQPDQPEQDTEISKSSKASEAPIGPFDDMYQSTLSRFHSQWEDLFITQQNLENILVKTVNDYLQLEKVYQRQLEALWSLPDEDGWVKMLDNKRGSSSAGNRFKPWKKTDRDAIIAKRKQEEKTKIPLFYNFQKRTQKRNELADLRKQVENDKKRIQTAQQTGYFSTLGE